MEYISFIAAILTTAAFLPQVYKTVKTQQAEDLSLITFTMIFVGTILWAIYGYSLDDKALMFANGLTAFFSGILLVIKIKSMITSK